MPTVEPPPESADVLLLTMPFVGLDRPALGLSLLQAQLRRKGMECKIRYLTFPFASFIGAQTYTWIADDLPYTAFVGEWLFTPFLYEERPDVDREYVDDILTGQWQLKTGDVDRLFGLRSYCKLFLDHCMQSIPWSDYSIVGFTSTFSQNIASLALALRIKTAHPNKIIVFGGANWEGEMGQELHRQFGFVDYVCSGEADHSFPALASGLGNGTCEPATIPGIVYRSNGKSVATGPAPLVRDMDDLPTPDYADFFQDLDESAVSSEIVPNLLIETSRGCWWGAKSHCTFCGLNGGAMSFRSKSPERVIEEIRHSIKRYGLSQFEVVDNILDMSYFKTVLPQLVEAQLDVALFYEIKSNLSRDQVRQLSEANVWVVQPGIESLSNHVLKLMRKGVSALQNIQLLKWCHEYGIQAEWNLLYGFPGELPADYEAMLPVLDAISFLRPPTGYGPVRLDRFSPYHGDPAGWGMTSVRPMAPYRFLFPFDEESLSKIAYYFDYDYADEMNPNEYITPVIDRILAWRDDRHPGLLEWATRANGDVVLDDSRSAWPRRRLLLRGWRADVYLSCDHVLSLTTLLKIGKAGGAVAEDVRAFLRVLRKIGVILEDDGRYLALAVRGGTAYEDQPDTPAALSGVSAPEADCGC